MMSGEWLEAIVSTYQKYVYEMADPRTAEWLMVKHPWNAVIIVSCYLYFSINARELTAKLRTYDLKSFIIFYNSVMVLLSTYMWLEFLAAAYNAGYSLVCQNVEYAPTPSAIRMAGVVWLYYFTKYIELTETIVFALRKKYQQITVLHVYHHVTMVCWSMFAVKYMPGGQAYAFGSINSFVHAVMYTYYGLSSLGPSMQKYLWWKKYITRIQLSQFVILFFYCSASFIFDCHSTSSMYPIMIGMVGYAITLFVLFSNFYFKAYVATKSSKEMQKNKTSKINNNNNNNNSNNNNSKNIRKSVKVN